MPGWASGRTTPTPTTPRAQLCSLRGLGALESAVNLGNLGSEAAPQQGLLRLQGEGHNGESKTRLFFPPEPRPLRPARGRLSQSQTLWAQDPPSGKAPHRQHWATPPDNCIGPRPQAQASPRIISSKFQVPPLSPRPSSRSVLPSAPHPRVEVLPSTWCRGAEVRRAPQRPPAPARRWGGLEVGVGVGVEAGASAGLGRPGDSGD